jgi:hypothetical protein
MENHQMDLCRNILVIFILTLVVSCGGGGESDKENITNNPTSVDTDKDGIADDADTDDDNDGVEDTKDAFPLDGRESVDTDADSMGNNADTDDDNDGVEDAKDAFPLDGRESVDTDADSIGNNADTDDDNDGVEDTKDAFPLDASESVDTDADSIGNNADTDDDNDGVEDAKDAFPLDGSESVDTDADSIGNNADTDDDNDGVEDTKDAFPLDASESVDTDADSIGNNADTDDDNDGVEDAKDAFPLDGSESVDSDLDGIGDNSDNYPQQSACHLKHEGNGLECYATWLPKQDVENIAASRDGNIYFYEKTQNKIIIYNLITSSFSEVNVKISESETLNKISYSSAHKRLYLGFSTGRITYLDSDDQQIKEFATMAESVDGLSTVGDFLLVQDHSGAWESHYIFDINGNQTDWKDWNHYSNFYAWNEALERVYFFKDTTSPNDLVFEEINQETGKIIDSGETPYHGDYNISGPILISPDGLHVFIGAGDIYNATSLIYEHSIGMVVDDAIWSQSTGLIGLRQNKEHVSLTRFNNDYSIVEQVEIPGTLIQAFEQNEKVVILVNNKDQLEFIEYVVNDDLDGDTIPNISDAFPNDISASVDSDNDGYPDIWNEGYAQVDSSTGLIIDAFPQDFICQLVEHADNEVCNINGRVSVISVDRVYTFDNINYSLSTDKSILNRWDSTSKSYLNPITLNHNELMGKPLAMAKDHNDTLLVGYDSGILYRYSANGLGQPELVKAFSAAIHEVFVTKNHYLIVTGTGSYYRDYFIVDRDGNITDKNNNGRYSNDYKFMNESQSFYWFNNTYSDSLNSSIINDDSGLFENYASFRYADGPTSFMSISNDESLIVTGDGNVIKNFGNANSKFNLPASLTLSDQAKLHDFVWLNGIAVGHYSENDKHVLTVYSSDLTKAFIDIPFEDIIMSINKVENGLAMLLRKGTELRFEVIDIERDIDEDTIPFWWEFAYGFSDTSAVDSALDSDSDRLTNLQEYQLDTEPKNPDTDGDGLDDGKEFIDLLLNPLLIDSDGDLIPDAWEVENGLKGNDASDALLDSDNDGVSNFDEYRTGTDPQKNTSVSQYLSNVIYSFEDSILPGELLPSTTSTFTNENSFDGSISMEIVGETVITWNRLFDNIELELYVFSNCYSSFSKGLFIEIDNEKLIEEDIEQSQWKKHKLLISKGFHEIKVNITSRDSNCSVFIDAIKVSPIKSLFEMGTNVVTQSNNTLNFYDYNSELLRSVKIPMQLSSNNPARGITILDDGRIAISNGTSTPVLSLYTPETNTWQHIKAPSWSSDYDDGIDSRGNHVFATNVSTNGSNSSGIVEFNLDDNSVNYINGSNNENLTVGQNGFIYGFNSTGIHKHSANDFSLIKSITIDLSYIRAIAVNENGDVFTVNWEGDVNRYDENGNLIKSLNVTSGLSEISIRKSGQVMLSDNSGNIYFTTQSLDTYTSSTLRGEFIDFVPDVDTDNDGLPDWWESGFSLDLNDANDSVNDLDSDGLTALQEYALGTKENEPDSDNDGLNDGNEHNTIGSNPLKADSDSDGLNDGQEVNLGTDPLKVDTDGDGLTDHEEYITFETSPLLADTDLDGMDDNYEIKNTLDPKVDDALLDPDGDGLSNKEEFTAATNPNNADTDGDLLNDYDELNVHSTSPLLADTDSDKLDDGWEIGFGLDANDATTALADTDSDLFTNIEEYYGQSDPTDSLNVPLPVTWQTHQGNATHTGYSPHIFDVNNFALKWKTSVDSMSQLNPVTASATQVFVSSDAYSDTKTVSALNADTGESNWQLSYPDIDSVNSPSFDKNSVYFQTGGHQNSFIRSVDASTGELNFESSYGNQWSRYLAPTIFSGIVYMAGGTYGGIYAFDAVSGVQDWFFKGPQYDEFTPAVDENFIYAFTTHLNIIDRKTGKLSRAIKFPDFNWLGYAVEIATVLSPEKNVVVTQQGSLVVFDTKSDTILWQRLNAGFNTQPSIANSIIYSIANGSLYAIDELTGVNKWIISNHSYQSNIIVTKTHIFVSDDTNTYAIDKATNAEVWAYPATGHLSLSETGVLYIASDELTAIQLK